MVDRTEEEYVALALNPNFEPPTPSSSQFNLISNENLSRILHQKILQFRARIVAIRDNNNIQKVAAYNVSFPIGTRIFGTPGHLQLIPNKTYTQLVSTKKIDTYPSKKYTGVKQIEVTANRAMTVVISANSLYPYYSGYAYVNTKYVECCKVWLDHQPFTLCDIRYGDKPSGMLNQWIGILIAEQARFNTLEVYRSSFLRTVVDWQTQQPVPVDDYITALDLDILLFNQFKVDIYNDWQRENQWVPIGDVSTKGIRVKINSENREVTVRKQLRLA